jgi:amidase
MAELHDLTALEQAAEIRRGAVSPAELVEHYLARVDRLSDDVGAFVTVTGDLARKQAALAAARLDEDGDQPPLFGVPTAVKDLNMTAGIRTTFGSATMAEHVPDVSDEVVLRLERAGMISLGKTNTPEFGSPCYTGPDGRGVERRRRGGRRGRAGAGRAGLRRRRVDPDPRELLRAVRAEAEPRPGQQRADVRRPDRPGHVGVAGAHGP